MKSGALCCAVVLLLAVSPGFAQQKYRIEANPVITPSQIPAYTNDPTHWAGPKAPTSGSFRIVKDNSGIPSTPTGGACLVANLVNRGIGASTCSKSTDCNPIVLRRPGRPDVPMFDKAEGYCIAVARGHSTCWVRPGKAEDYCLRSADIVNGAPRGPLVADKDYRLPTVPGNPTRDRRPVTWRVYACLNPAGTKACGDTADDSEQVHIGAQKVVH